MAVTIDFLGAAGTVTGSKFLLRSEAAKVLIDCGLFQGQKELRLKNWDAFPIDPATLDAVVISHAHLDHVGYLPRLVRGGFTGKIYLTKYTAKLAEIILRDSAKIQMEDAEFARIQGFSKHNPPLPLYTDDDAEATIKQFVVVNFRIETVIAAETKINFRPSGHILGAAFIEVEISGKKLLFSGDLGRPVHPILTTPDPTPNSEFDAVLIESTYGDQLHASGENVLAQAINRTISRKGIVVIPAFAVDRTEILILELKQLMQQNQIPEVPIFLDSPMASSALDCYRSAIAEDSAEIKVEIKKLPAEQDIFEMDNLFETQSVSESKALNFLNKPAIIIAASGMATGGRVVHHLARLLPDSKNTVILVGFQAPGTRGSDLLNGAAAIKMHGRHVAVAADVVYLPGLSVHADQAELMQWLQGLAIPPKRVFVIHGEDAGPLALSEKITAKFKTEVIIPIHNSSYVLD